jgi:hypothetical protein
MPGGIDPRTNPGERTSLALVAVEYYWLLLASVDPGPVPGIDPAPGPAPPDMPGGIDPRTNPGECTVRDVIGNHCQRLDLEYCLYPQANSGIAPNPNP